MATTDIIEGLRNAAHRLDGSNAEKALSLVDFFARKGYLTDGQQRLAGYLLQRTKPQAEKLDLTALTALFDTARAKGAKKMALRFLDERGRRFVVSAASESSRNPGWLYVKTGDDYLGKIAPDGNFVGSAMAGVADAQTALVSFCRDPQAAAVRYGTATDTCMFCGLQLTDDRSKAVKYGPRCAEKWGLPWGGK